MVMAVEETETATASLKPHTRVVLLLTSYLWEQEHALRTILGKKAPAWEEVCVCVCVCVCTWYQCLYDCLL
jgi:hypothetical protein